MTSIHTSIYYAKTRNAEFSVNILKSAVKMYPLLDTLQRGLDLHTWREKIKMLFQNLYKTTSPWRKPRHTKARAWYCSIVVLH